MPTIATVLKSEIARVARKELRADTEAVKKAVTGYRHELVAVKRRMQDLERQLKALSKGVAKGAAAKRAAAADEEETSGRQLRFSASRFAAQRKKLGISAADFALLLGVSSLSVYKWEHGQTRPRQKQLEAIAAARKLGKREAQQRLAELKAA